LWWNTYGVITAFTESLIQNMPECRRKNILSLELILGYKDL